MACVYSCPKHHVALDDWCRPCLDEWVADQERKAVIRELEHAAAEAGAIPDATDAEWLRYLDSIAPRAAGTAGVPLWV